EPRQRADLAPEALAVRLGQVGSEYLERDGPLEVDVARLEDVGHPSDPQGPEDLVAAVEHLAGAEHAVQTTLGRPRGPCEGRGRACPPRRRGWASRSPASRPGTLTRGAAGSRAGTPSP